MSIRLNKIIRPCSNSGVSQQYKYLRKIYGISIYRIHLLDSRWFHYKIVWHYKDSVTKPTHNTTWFLHIYKLSLNNQSLIKKLGEWRQCERIFGKHLPSCEILRESSTKEEVSRYEFVRLFVRRIEFHSINQNSGRIDCWWQWLHQRQ